ncbi:hypothetical protein [Candidatus Nitrotoga sp. M5]|nr:hypothetical protein [Candidatus Nitrotoga sp. M5]CAH1386336.1 hypothetical protein NTGM5_260053 [Candidatus Nitrotoga sp. M5]
MLKFKRRQLLQVSATVLATRTLIATVTACIATMRLPFRPDRIEPREKKR